MVIKGNGAVNTMEAVKINTKEKERTKVKIGRASCRERV